MTRIENIIKNLRKRNIEGLYFEEVEDAVKKIKTYYSDKDTISSGGSITLEEIGLLDDLRENHQYFLDRQGANNKEERDEIAHQSLLSDVYFTSANAITEKGEIICMDGTGNRAAAMIYGPKKVVVIVGVNKLVLNNKDGIKRIHQIAAPLNAKRKRKNTPCGITGECSDCNSIERMCNNLIRIQGQRVADRMKVIIIGDTLGY